MGLKAEDKMESPLFRESLARCLGSHDDTSPDLGGGVPWFWL